MGSRRGGVHNAPVEPRWEHFEHDADLGVRGIGATLAEAFAQAALAVTAAVTDPTRVALQEEFSLDVEAGDPEFLLVGFLNRMIAEMATRHVLFGGIQVQLEGNRLHAVLRGERADVDRHQPAVEVKGATLTELAVWQRNGEWIAQTVVDV